ncbi:hypothetical protein DPV78_011073 [Talaromyces pinophilus]|nr:hypothetical protein DPV78_011073 [Talaromyces pinophilus]
MIDPAVVVPVVVAIILISIIATLFARRRHRARQRGQLADDSTIYGAKKAELPAEQKNRHELSAWGNEPMWKLEDTSPQELPVPVIISEFSAPAERYPEEHSTD